ncbi:MAG TPA: hypothetical protein VGL09_04095 [Methylomirabilota bacterium]|jgi:hypothetical protein
MSKAITVVLVAYLVLGGFPLAGPPSAVAGACDNSIVSVKAGTTSWYRTTAGDSSLAYTVRITEVSESGFTERHEFENAMFDVGWRCLPDGLRALDRAMFGARGDSTKSVKFETVSASGVHFPVRSRWIPGATWTESYTVRLAIPNAPMVFPPLTFTNRYQVVGRERVAVLAGSFDAFKVTITETSEGHPGLNQSGHLWVADGGVLVKAETRNPDDGKLHRVELVKLQR